MRMSLILGGILALVVGGALYVRLAPSDPAIWHVLPDVTDNETGVGEAKRRVAGDADTLVALDAIARATPRTRVLAGDLASGHITYVTRSLVLGFPDYTSVAVTPEGIALWARLRFGRSDFGVNAARLDSWLRQLAEK